MEMRELIKIRQSNIIGLFMAIYEVEKQKKFTLEEILRSTIVSNTAEIDEIITHNTHLERVDFLNLIQMSLSKQREILQRFGKEDIKKTYLSERVKIKLLPLQISFKVLSEQEATTDNILSNSLVCLTFLISIDNFLKNNPTIRTYNQFSEKDEYYDEIERSAMELYETNKDIIDEIQPELYEEISRMRIFIELSKHLSH